MSRVPVRGGPLDGAEVAKSGSFRWLDYRGGHRTPGPGRTLYRLVSGGYERNGRRFERHYAFVGPNARFCKPCEAVVGRRKKDPPLKCPMCDAPTQPSYQPKEE